MALTCQTCPEETQSGEGWNCSGHVWSDPPHMPSCDCWGLVVHTHSMTPGCFALSSWLGLHRMNLISSAPPLTLRSILLQPPPSQQMAIPALCCLPPQKPWSHSSHLLFSQTLCPIGQSIPSEVSYTGSSSSHLAPPPLPAPGISHHFSSPGWPHHRSLLPRWLPSSLLLPWQPKRCC